MTVLRVTRREIVATLGSAAAWPMVARAQQSTSRMNRIGVLMPFGKDDPQYWLGSQHSWTGYEALVASMARTSVVPDPVRAGIVESLGGQAETLQALAHSNMG